MALLVSIVVLLALAATSMVRAKRYRKQMRELQSPEERQESLDQIVGRFSWMRGGF